MRFDYNSAIIDTRNEQMLANLVRLRYRDTPRRWALWQLRTTRHTAIQKTQVAKKQKSRQVLVIT